MDNSMNPVVQNPASPSPTPTLAGDNNKKKSNKTAIIVIIIVAVVVLGFIGMFILVFAIVFSAVDEISKDSSRLVCRGDNASVTIMYREGTINGYTQTNVNFDVDNENRLVREMGMDAYLKNYKEWFESNYTNGVCLMGLPGNDELIEIPSDEVDPEEARKLEERDEQRSDDVALLITSINDFQANNNGKTPWDSGDMSNQKRFLQRYIDENIKYNETTNFVTSCKYFVDPSGYCYQLQFVRELSSSDVDENDEYNVTGKVKNFDRTFYVFTKAKCVDGDSKVVALGSGVRSVAVVIKGEGGDLYCADNM